MSVSTYCANVLVLFYFLHLFDFNFLVLSLLFCYAKKCLLWTKYIRACKWTDNWRLGWYHREGWFV